MNTQLERLFHSLRRGIEANVVKALKNIELPTQKELRMIRTRIDEIKKGDLRAVRKKLDEVKTTLGRIEAVKPYLSAVEAAGRAYKKSAAPKKTATGRQRTKKTSKRAKKK